MGWNSILLTPTQNSKPGSYFEACLLSTDSNYFKAELRGNGIMVSHACQIKRNAIIDVRIVTYMGNYSCENRGKYH